MELEIGSTVGDYQVVSVLGAGGMGKVYKVRNVISDRFEAMKVLLADLEHAPELADRFMREIKVHASLEHPNIAGLRTALRVENQLLMVMELVDGITLQQKLQQGPIPAAIAVDYIKQVLSALEYAHGRGVVHRDVKPANMMLTPAGVVKLLDFGIAKATSDHGLTMTGTTLGSSYYMSPEQIQGAANLDGRTDIYSVGVSLYELVTGKKPFDGDSQYAIMAAHLERNPPPPIEVDARLPRPLSDVILMSVARRPEERFQTAGAFSSALRSVSGAAAPAAAPPPAVSPAKPAPRAMPVAATAARSRRGLWMALGALVMAAVVIALIQFGPWRGTKAAPVPETTRSTPAVPAQQPTAAPAASPQASPVVPGAPEPAIATTPPQTPPNPQPVRRTAQKEAVTPARPAPQTPALTQPAPAASAASQASQPPPAPALPSPTPATRAELQEAREQLVQLGARANGLHMSLQTLERSQSSNGLNLRGDMVEAASLMDSYLQGANAALNAGDAASAKSLLGKAELQVERLEKFLNR